MNSCDISEDETTNALYQMPMSEGQNNIQTHASETAFGVNSADALKFGRNQKNSSSDVLPDRGMKKHVFKEKMMSGKINAQASGKNRSMNDVNQHPTDSKPMKTMSSKHSSRFDNMNEDKYVSEEKEMQISGGTSFNLGLIYCYFRLIFLFEIESLFKYSRVFFKHVQVVENILS